GAEGGSRGLCLRRRKVAASPPHRLFRLHFLDMRLISSRLNRFYLLEKSALAYGFVLLKKS
ncbi:MAG: hypothetical protein FWH20_03045, partial [Oscillospiraceae bacterium]|nr:hypothetical protein [Oscillospiraceae bacterium]